MTPSDIDARIERMRAAIDPIKLAACVAQGLLSRDHEGDYIAGYAGDLVVFVQLTDGARGALEYVWATRDAACASALRENSPGEIMSLRANTPDSKILVRVQDGDLFTYVTVDLPAGAVPW